MYTISSALCYWEEDRKSLLKRFHLLYVILKIKLMRIKIN